MSSSIAVPSLMYMTLGIVLIIGIVVFLQFWRKRSNHHPMAGHKERNIDEIRRGVPPER